MKNPRRQILIGLARLGVRSPRAALLVTLLLSVAAGYFGASAAGHLSGGGLTDPASPSSRANTFLQAHFGVSTPKFLLMVHCPGGVDSPTSRLGGVVLTARLSQQLATAVMRRPVIFGASVTGVLVLLGLPFLSVHFGFADYRALPHNTSSYRAGATLRADFSGNEAYALQIAVPRLTVAQSRLVGTYARNLSQLGAVSSVVSPTGTFSHGGRVSANSTPVIRGATYLVVEDDAAPYTQAGAQLVREVRAVPSPAPALVTGAAATSVDALSVIGADLP